MNHTGEQGPMYPAGVSSEPDPLPVAGGGKPPWRLGKPRLAVVSLPGGLASEAPHGTITFDLDPQLFALILSIEYDVHPEDWQIAVQIIQGCRVAGTSIRCEERMADGYDELIVYIDPESPQGITARSMCLY